MRKIFTLLLLLCLIRANGQEAGSAQNDNKTTLGGYGQIDLNAPIGEEWTNNAELDVHRIVLMFGHRFSERVSFVTEVEFEHVKEVYIEQAYLDYRLNSWMTFRGGLVLIPMGIINLNHESATFNSVERPIIDNKLIPTTWREIGAGFTGKFLDLGIAYQFYIVNGFKSYDEGGLLGGGSGLRSGRQKGAESIMRFPNLAFRTEYFGIENLELGFSLYTGKTQSALYDGLPDDAAQQSLADSSVVGIFMLGLDARYTRGPLQLRFQLYNTSISNTTEYNAFTGRDLGSGLFGYYFEAAYDVLNHCEKSEAELFPFLRYTAYNLHASTEGIDANPGYEAQAITAGLSFKPSPGAAFKIGYQWLKNGKDEDENLIQAGVAFNF